MVNTSPEEGRQTTVLSASAERVGFVAPLPGQMVKPAR
jgi:hypothetical protein